MSFIRKPKLLSPPVSPETKSGKKVEILKVEISSASTDNQKAVKSSPSRASITVSDTNSETHTLIEPTAKVRNNDDYMTIKAFSTSKRGLHSFLKAYKVRMGKDELRKKRKLLDKRSINAVERPNVKRAATKVKPTTAEAGSSSSSTLSPVGSYPQFNRNDREGSLAIRDYKTRSKREDLFDGSNEISSCVAPQNSYAFRFEFLKSISVQEIHDAPVENIPDFAPKMNHVTVQHLQKELKRLGFSSNKGLRDSSGLHLVDSKEIILVSSLRLAPHQYHDTKKRFFAEKARKTYLQTTFKKTDAQKACRLDVNKASKLYEIFQSCGLLKDELFTHDN